MTTSRPGDRVAYDIARHQRNEAAERLRVEMQEGFDVSGRTSLLDEALAAERRATVERMQRETQRAYRRRTGGGAPDAMLGAMEDAAILDDYYRTEHEHYHETYEELLVCQGETTEKRLARVSNRQKARKGRDPEVVRRSLEKARAAKKARQQ